MPIRHVKGHVLITFVKSRAAGVIFVLGADRDWVSRLACVVIWPIWCLK